MDHSGQIEFLSPEIKIGLGEGTKRYLEFFTDYTSNDQLLTFKPLFQRNESGKRKYKDFEKKTRAIQIIGREWKQIESTPFRIKFIPTDHSVWGAGAWLIEDIKSNIKFVYTGEILAAFVFKR